MLDPKTYVSIVETELKYLKEGQAPEILNDEGVRFIFSPSESKPDRFNYGELRLLEKLSKFSDGGGLMEQEWVKQTVMLHSVKNIAEAYNKTRRF